jgi:outer membrane biosynthesis protein TonB
LEEEEMKLTPEMMQLLMTAGLKFFNYWMSRPRPAGLTDAEIIAKMKAMIIEDADDLMGPIPPVVPKPPPPPPVAPVVQHKKPEAKVHPKPKPKAKKKGGQK